MSREPRPTQRTIDQVAEGDILVRAGQLDLYRALSSEPRTVGGRQAVAIEYAYVVDPYEAALGAERIPVVVRGVEVLAPSDRFLYRIDFRAAESVFNVDRAVFERILRRVVF